MAGLVSALGRRLGLCVAVLALVSLGLGQLPGDGLRAALGTAATEAQLAELRHQLWFDRPWPARFGHWLLRALTGDFGDTLHGARVADVVAATLPNTLLLAGSALAVVALLAPVLGGWWALSASGRRTAVLTTAITVAIATPEFVIALALLVVFAVWLRLLPASSLGESDPAAFLLPITALALPQLAWNAAVTHAAVLDQLRAPHVTAAIRDGLPWRQVLLRHLSPAVLPAVAGSLATTAGLLFAGALVIETVFNIPGVGQVLAAGTAGRDMNLVLGALTPAVVLISLGLAAADLARRA